ncbi:MAG: leucine-rich repeat domain-containing protein, partial [Clostridiales bacterium]|nr:leucine-rich repeat domain-containing protein [Clostridiales bacterium]
ILLAYRGNQADVVIPADVKTIGADAFSQHTEIESVDIPGSVIKIDDNAFGGCSQLTKITGALNVTSISDDAFAGCGVTLLSETVTIDENQTAIPLGSYFIVENKKMVNWIAVVKWSSIVSIAILAVFMLAKSKQKQIRE